MVGSKNDFYDSHLTMQPKIAAPFVEAIISFRKLTLVNNDEEVFIVNSGPTLFRLECLGIEDLVQLKKKSMK